MQVDERHKIIIAKNCQYLIGIDEAGRGALAGPVAVGVVGWPINQSTKLKQILRDYPRGRDSKKLNPKQREFWFGQLNQAKREGLLAWQVALVGNQIIDRQGINSAIRLALGRGLARLHAGLFGLDPKKSLVLLDGGLKASAVWPNQETIIKGDEKELIIALASIVAKVSRDSLMVSLAKKYPTHHLDKHKGYGTRIHYQTIAKFGLLLIHRRSYLRSEFLR